ncbi:MAG: transcriptional regulator [Caulobacter sp.]|nr:transcriptional regulator [Caulobacter sp.]
MTLNPPLLTTAQAATHLGLSRHYLNDARVTGTGPAYVKLGALVRYRHADLDAWVAAALRHSTQDAAPRAGGDQ